MLKICYCIILVILVSLTITSCGGIGNMVEKSEILIHSKNIDSDDPEIRISALAGLRRYDLNAYPDIVYKVLNLLDDDEAKVRDAAVTTLVWTKPPEDIAIPILLKMINSDDYKKRKSVLEYLKYSGYRTNEAFKIVMDAFVDDTAGVRRAAYRAIIYWKPELGIIKPYLDPLMQGTEPNGKYYAIKIYKYYGDHLGVYNQDIVDVIQALLYDQSIQVPIAASGYLRTMVNLYKVNINIEDITPAILCNLGSETKLINCTIDLLGVIGPPAEFAIPQLIELLDNERSYIRLNSAVAIIKIDPSNHQAAMSTLQELRDEGDILTSAIAEGWIEYLSENSGND